MFFSYNKYLPQSLDRYFHLDLDNFDYFQEHCVVDLIHCVIGAKHYELFLDSVKDKRLFEVDAIGSDK